MIFVGRPCGSGASDVGFRRKHAISVLYTPLFSGLLEMPLGYEDELEAKEFELKLSAKPKPKALPGLTRRVS